MTVPLKIEANEAAILRAHYRGIAHSTLRIIWHRKLLIVVIAVVPLCIASIALALVGPRYKGEATIQLNFDREEEPTAGAKIQRVTSVDPIALVDSAARAIRSRATATAVVARFGLDKDPDFVRESMLQHGLWAMRTMLGLDGAMPSPCDVAVGELMQKVVVTNEPRSYFISIMFTARDPEQAARLANAVALEYLRAQLLQQLVHAQAEVERHLAQLSSVYGVRHPSYVHERARLENLQSRLSALRDGPLTEDAVKLVTGELFVPAQRNTVPVGPKIKLILGLTLGAGLAAGIWLAWLLDSDRQNKWIG
jgi:uncharacterized protein involved in exopolysaccharide biosynthesis